MALSNQLRNQHLMWRAGFGPAVEQLNSLDKTSPEKLYKALQKHSPKKPEYLQAADNYLQGLMLGIQDAGRLQKQEMSAEPAKRIAKKEQGRNQEFEPVLGRGDGKHRCTAPGKNVLFLAWSFCLPKLKRVFSTGAARCHQAKCSWKFSRSYS